MTAYPIKKVGVIGLGLMGHGVAQVTAQAGYDVIAIESQPDVVRAGMKRIEDSLEKVAAREFKNGKIKTLQEGTDKSKEILSRIKTGTKLSDAVDCDLIIEAIVEKEDVKIEFYSQLGHIVKPNAIFASNTSSLSITPMAIASGRPSLFVGLHFFNPVQIMKLVEVIKTPHSDPIVFDRVTEFTKSIGKVPVSCGDTPGFIVNRLLVPYLAQALLMLDRGDATIKDIDVSMQLGAGHPMGPIQLADYVGLDTTYSILSGWKEAYPEEPSFCIPKCLVEKVNSAHFGRKTGKGFYIWEGDKAVAVA